MIQSRERRKLWKNGKRREYVEKEKMVVEGKDGKRIERRQNNERRTWRTNENKRKRDKRVVGKEKKRGKGRENGDGLTYEEENAGKKVRND